MDAIGFPVDRATISRIESSRRPITVDELFAFAFALHVSPKALLVPRESEAAMRVTPNYEFPARAVVFWVRGDSDLWVKDRADRESARYFYEAVTNDEWQARNRPGVGAILQGAHNLEWMIGTPLDREPVVLERELASLELAIQSVRLDLEAEKEKRDGEHR
jgi:transcriptional regulator with XRE-family HTH domain